MTQLIDKKAVLEAVKALPVELDAETVQRCIEILSNQPAVDAVPVEWIMKYYEDHPAGFVTGMIYDWAMEQAERGEE